MAEIRIPSCPGEILQEEMAARGLSADRLAEELGLEPGLIVEILNGRLSITTDVAVRLSQYLGTSAGIWLDMQLKHDLALFERDQGVKVRSQVARCLGTGELLDFLPASAGR